MRKNRLFKRLNGFQKAPRRRFILLYEGTLNQEEFLLYELGVAIIDWDENHVETYGSFEATNLELAEILGWKSDTTAGRHKNSLIRKKLFLVRDDERIEPKGFEKWRLRKTDAKTHELDAKIATRDADLQGKDAKIEEKQLQSNNYSLGSYTDHLVSEELTDKEIDELPI